MHLNHENTGLPGLEVVSTVILGPTKPYVNKVECQMELGIIAVMIGVVIVFLLLG